MSKEQMGVTLYIDFITISFQDVYRRENRWFLRRSFLNAHIFDLLSGYIHQPCSDKARDYRPCGAPEWRVCTRTVGLTGAGAAISH